METSIFAFHYHKHVFISTLHWELTSLPSLSSRSKPGDIWNDESLSICGGCHSACTTVRAWVPSQALRVGMTLTSLGRASWKWSCLSWKWHKAWSDSSGAPTGMRELKLMLCRFCIMSVSCGLLWYSGTSTILTDWSLKWGLALSLTSCVILGKPCYLTEPQRRSRLKWISLISLTFPGSTECYEVTCPRQQRPHNSFLVS